RLVIGGYGMFGIIRSVVLRLVRRLRLRRLVDVMDLDDAVHTVPRRIQQGCLYGDFQFAIDARDTSFLRRGVLACYQPVDESSDDRNEQHRQLSREQWLELLKLAHYDKPTAFGRYAQHYLSTHDQRYWSDTMQLSTYVPQYADLIHDSGASKSSLLI